MPRVARTVFAGLPHYVTQGGNLCENVFFLTDAHRRTYLIGLKEYCKKHGVEILAYCLMSNHYSSWSGYRAAKMPCMAYGGITELTCGG